MPIYEYLCEQCQHRFEVKQGMNDPPVSGCVRCGNAVKKIISAPAIMFKGTGWYVTDYSDKLKPPTGAEPAPAPGNGKPDQKPSKETTTASTGDAATPSSSDSAGTKASAGSTSSGSPPPPTTPTSSSKS